MGDRRSCLLPQILTSSSEQLEQQQQQQQQQQKQKHKQHWYVLACVLELSKIKNGMDVNGKDEGFGDFPHRKERRLLVSRCQSRSRICCSPAQSSSVFCPSESAVCNEQQQGESCEGSGDYIIPGLYDDNIERNCFSRFLSRSDYSALASVNRRLHSLVQSGDLYVMRRLLGIVEHWIYVACTLDRWEAFDPTRQRWMRLPRMQADDCFFCADKESLAVGTELLVFGREVRGIVIWRYSILTHSWYRGPPMNLPRCLFGSASDKQIAIVAGGCDASGSVLKSAELYNSEQGTWEALPDMHSPRKLCSGFFMDGKFYAIGGMINHTESLTCGEEFNLETRTWRRIPDMFPGGNAAAHAPPLVAVVNNQLYAVEHSQNEVKKYNKNTNMWTVLGRLPVRADSTNGWGLAFKACGNDLIVIGGQRGPEGESIELNSWHPTAEGGPPEWNAMVFKKHAGVFVYNCAVMGC